MTQKCEIEQFESRVLLSAAPVVTLAPAGPLTYTENSGAVVIAGASTVTDSDSANFNGGNMTESITANAAAGDTLGIRNQGTAAGQIGVSGNTVQFGAVTIGTFTGGTGATPLVVTFNANATPAAVTALQENITFQSSADPDVSNASRVFSSVVTDAAGGNSSVAATETINIVEESPEANPVVTLNASNLTISNSAPTVIAPAATITSVDSDTLAGGKLTVSLTNATARDRLAIQSQGALSVVDHNVEVNGQVIARVTGGVGGVPLVVRFNAHATLADAQLVAQNVTFRSIGHFAQTTAVNFKLTDGDGGVSNTASTMLTIMHGKAGNPGGGDGGDEGGDEANGGNNGKHHGKNNH